MRLNLLMRPMPSRWPFASCGGGRAWQRRTRQPGCMPRENTLDLIAALKLAREPQLRRNRPGWQLNARRAEAQGDEFCPSRAVPSCTCSHSVGYVGDRVVEWICDRALT